MTLEPNICLQTDGYKPTQVGLDPENVKYLMGYTTARGGMDVQRVIFFGLQYILKKYLEGRVVTDYKIQEASEIYGESYGYPYFVRSNWEYILDKYHGMLPISIRAIPEGTRVPIRAPMMTVVNTDPECAWLVPYIESVLLKVYAPSTIATMDYEMHQIFTEYAKACGEDKVPVCFDNDFGYRGMRTEEEAEFCGPAHLLVDPGSDTMPAIRAAKYYYNNGARLLTVRATEHHTMQTYGPDHEVEAYRTVIRKTPSNAILSLVTDTWNADNAHVNMLGGVLKEEILAREGKTVFRPDSGDPVEVAIKSLYQIKDAFGGNINKDGYWINNPKIGLLMGDQISYPMMKKVLHEVLQEKFAISNLCFGMGGQRYAITRDTLGFTTKECAYATEEKNGEILWHATYKNPVSSSFKKSLGGRLKLVNEKGNLETRTYDEPGDDEMIEVFRNGPIKKQWRFYEVQLHMKRYP